jgi:arginyl-tRNA synthetase
MPAMYHDEAAVEASASTKRVEFVISQIVRKLLREGDVVRLSKKGVVSPCATYSMRSGMTRRGSTSSCAPSTRITDFDLTRQAASENPVYYVQYAHTRTCGVLRAHRMTGPAFSPMIAPLERLGHADELALLARSPTSRRDRDRRRDPRAAAPRRSPANLPRCSTSLYTTCRVVDPADRELTERAVSPSSRNRTVLATICGYRASRHRRR